MTATDLAREAAETAEAAGLNYSTDAAPGIRREPAGDGFRYIGPDGREVTDEGELRRIRALAIPPAYTDVWISPDPQGHIQATARDARGRKQYRYHPRWREVRDESKYHRTIAFGRALPRIRAATDRDLRLPGLPRRKVLAAVVRLLELTHIRVGNDEYARANRSYGLTTLRDRHVRVEDSRIRFRFRGKSGKDHEVTLRDRRLARIVARCRDLPGQELFQYVDDDGVVQDVGSADVNAYLREISGEPFTAKDFRTWAGTVFAAGMLREIGPFETAGSARQNLARAIESVAERLGNTPSVCRKCYVHPVVVDAYLDGTLLETLRRLAAQELRDPETPLSDEERTVLQFLEERLAAA